MILGYKFFVNRVLFQQDVFNKLALIGIFNYPDCEDPVQLVCSKRLAFKDL